MFRLMEEPTRAGLNPWDGMSRDAMPGYWLLASLGKRVLRPGGIELTRTMLASLDIKPSDSVIEYAPGMGVTARMALVRNPREYVAIDRSSAATALLGQAFAGQDGRTCISADASEPLDLPDGFATVVYGESMMTIHSEEKKERIIGEVRRLLQAGGRYAMQELSVLPDDIAPELAETIRRDVMRAVRHPAWPKTTGQWREFLTRHGFEIIAEHSREVRLLEPERLIEDEGEQGAFGFAWNALQDDVAVKRVREIRSIYRRYRENLCAYSLVCRRL